MSTTTATSSDPWEMALIHRLIRRGFEQARDAVASVPDGDRAVAVAAYLRFQFDGLHAHHSTEDELLWPALRERASMSDELVDRMEEQHAAIHDALERARDLLPGWTADPTAEASNDLRTALDAVLDTLSIHLADEEREVVPLIAAHITQAEWDHLGKVAFSKFEPSQRFTAMGEMLAAASPDEAARMMATLPLPVRLVWRLVGRRSYERSMVAVRG
jgi:hemerythrin-like domain-containing protein